MLLEKPDTRFDAWRGVNPSGTGERVHEDVAAPSLAPVDFAAAVT